MIAQAGQIVLEVDARGLRCPEPLMKLYAGLGSIAPGETLRFVADDPASWRDVHRMCEFLHHNIVSARRNAAAQQGNPDSNPGASLVVAIDGGSAAAKSAHGQVASTPMVIFIRKRPA